MDYSERTDTLTTREIEYTILLKDKDNGFHELDKLLRSELTRFGNHSINTDKYNNPIPEYLNSIIERNIAQQKKSNVYFLNYEEQGSLNIRFSILLISPYIYYGSMRQALDFLVKDTVAGYFEDILERHLPVSVTVETCEKGFSGIPGEQVATEDTHRMVKHDYPALILATSALLIALFTGLFWFYQNNNSTTINKSGNEYKEKYLDLLMKTHADKAKSQQESYNSLPSDNDTLNDSLKTEK